jgi:hypothetical protein
MAPRETSVSPPPTRVSLRPTRVAARGTRVSLRGIFVGARATTAARRETGVSPRAIDASRRPIGVSFVERPPYLAQSRRQLDERRRELHEPGFLLVPGAPPVHRRPFPVHLRVSVLERRASHAMPPRSHCVPRGSRAKAWPFAPSLSGSLRLKGPAPASLPPAHPLHAPRRDPRRLRPAQSTR